MHMGELVSQFQAMFGGAPRTFAAPGRVNLIGEHTDYNDGFVMPCALAFKTHVAIAPRTDGRLVVRSTAFPEQGAFEVSSLPEKKTGVWYDYVVGVAVMLQRAGCPVPASSLLVHGEVPIGAGLSSSASIEVATALALTHSSGTRPEVLGLAKLCRAAENQFVGAHVGIMDQYVACFGKAGHSLLIDCRSLSSKTIPLPNDISIVVCNTMVKHALASGEYNLRRRECEQAVAVLSKACPGVTALRDVSMAQLDQSQALLPEIVYRRCHHVISENARVVEGANALAEGNLQRFGVLMQESHKSLRDFYEVSCAELDIMVEAAEGLPGFHGARMTGGGFGGCTVNLVDSTAAPSFAEQIVSKYQQKTGTKPDVYVCTTADGASEERQGADR